MQVTFWGTRGSIAKAGPSTIRYGGNTSCVEVRTASDTLVVIDAGTGIHGLGQDLLARSNGRPTTGHLLITHTHWDHIQGLPFFAPLFAEGHQWTVHGPAGLGTSLADALAGQMDYSYFPVGLDELAANIDYHDLVEGSFEIDDLKITARYLNHPALTLGYRLEADGRSFVYASDHEPYDAALAHGGDLSSNPGDAAHLDFLRGADLVVHDAQYLGDEYAAHKCGWGHSPVEYVVDAAHQADVGELALFHHDPARTDALLDDLLVTARARAARVNFAGRLTPAIEGQTIDLGTGASQLVASAPVEAHRAQPASAVIDDVSPAACAVCIEVVDPEAAEAVRAAAQAEDISIVDEPTLANLRIVERQTRCEHTGLRLTLHLTAVGSGDEEHHQQLAWPSPHVYVRTKLRAWLLDQVHSHRVRSN